MLRVHRLWHKKLDHTFVMILHDLVKMVGKQKRIDNNIKFIVESYYANNEKITYLDYLISVYGNRYLTAEI